mmetsp:Transcript_6572/g.13204  ORF Transcript_6572/g.13204 Transcript_6572/m.13204 type:complete len:252 (-) Transcript_6572:9-764(-)
MHQLLTRLFLLGSLILPTTPFIVPSLATSRNRNKFPHAPLRTTMKQRAIPDLWQTYNEALLSNPLLTKSLTAGVILGSADLVGQTFQSSDADSSSVTELATEIELDGAGIDFGRAGRFAFFGLVLQAPWNHFYYQILDGVLPPTADPFTTTTAVKVLIDQFVQAPIFTVLIFTFLGVLEGKSLDKIKQQLDSTYIDTMLANWKLWIPATVVNIAFCPPLFRVLFLNVVFFFWSIYLSIVVNSDDVAADNST